MSTFFVRAGVISEDVSISSNDLTLINSVRVARTVQEYTISATARNNSSKAFRNVVAQLIKVPAGISIVDGQLNFGEIAANGVASSTDVFVIQLNLRTTPTPQLSDMQWQLSGDEVLQPPPVAPAKAGLFMSIDNNVIKGDSDSASHAGWIELLSWQEGASMSFSDMPPGSGSDSGKLQLADVVIAKLIDSTSPLLREALAKGRIFDEVKIDIIRSCNQTLYTQYAISLYNVVFSSIQSGGNSDSSPVEQLSLSISALESSYTPVDATCKLGQPIYSFQTLNK